MLLPLDAVVKRGLSPVITTTIHESEKRIPEPKPIQRVFHGQVNISKQD